MIDDIVPKGEIIRVIKHIFLTTQSFVYDTLLTSLARSITRICWLIHSLTDSLTHSQARGKVNDEVSQHQAVLQF